MKLLLITCSLSAALCVACAPATRVTLLPGSASAPVVEVATAQRQVRLEQPYAEADVSRRGHVSVTTSSVAQVQSRYGTLPLLGTATPHAEELTFAPGGTSMTADSQARFAAALDRLQEHPDAVLHIESTSVATPLEAARIQALQAQCMASGIAPERIRITAPVSPTGNSPAHTDATGLRIFVR